MRRTLAAAVLIVLVGACGGQRSADRPKKQAAPPLEAIRLDARLPGEPARGRFRDEHGKPLAEVHVLASAETASGPVRLLLGRRDDHVPCIGAGLPGVEDAELDCLERWERPPLVPVVVIGGNARPRTDWLVVLGLVREPTATLTVQPQSFAALPVPLRDWEGFPWRAFAIATEARNLANMLTAKDAHGEPVIAVQVSWSYGPPRERHGERWMEVRDPIADASGGDYAAHAIAFRNPAVRRLTADHTFFIEPTWGWEKCTGESIGAILALRFWPPVEFAGELPYTEDARDEDAAPYREGRAYVEAHGIRAVEVSVDLNRRRVVGVDLQAYDATGPDEEPTAEIDELEVLAEPEPAGGRDDPEQCPKHEIGD